jgi:cell division protein FtsN
LSRAAAALAIGIALVLAGGFAVGIFVGRKPVPVASPTAENLPPQPPAPPALAEPVQHLPEPSPASAPAPPPGPSLPAAQVPHEQVAVAKPPVAMPARPERVATAIPVPERKPVPPPAATMHAKPRAEPHAKPAERQGAPAAQKSGAVPHHKPAPLLPQPSSSGRWVVQLGAFQSDDHAKLLVDTLAYHGHPARIAGGHDKTGRDWFFVQTPGYATRADAESVAKVLATREHVPTFVFEMRAPPGN